MKKFFLFLIMLLTACSAVWADAVSFEATVNSSRVSLDEALQLTLTITGVNDNLEPVSLPVIDGFSAKYLGPSTSVSIVNGDYHSERSFIYNLFPNRVGKFQIPPISATISGQTYTTKPIEVEVFESSAQAQAAGGADDQSQVPSVESFQDKILVEVFAAATDVYLNERIPVTIKLLINDVPLRDIQMPQFDKTGFLVDEFEKPQQASEVVNGVRYDMVEFKTNIYPDRLGDLTFGPVEFQGNILYKTGQNNPFGQDNSFFGQGFDNFFDSYATRPITKSSKPVIFHVSALPDEDRPAGFSGAIGQFDFKATVSPLQVKAGDPLTLKMDLKGKGNFKNLKMPEFHGEGFKSYAPQVKEGDDEKTAEEVIIPTLTSLTEVPALQFSYFDPSLKEYKTIAQGPFPIHVTTPNPEQDFKAIGFADISKGASVQSANQFSLGKLINSAYQSILKLSRSIWFWIGLGLVVLAGAAYFFWRRFQDRLENDPAFARRLKAVREARKTLVPADGYIVSGKTKEFYALLSKALRDYFANKWHLPSAALNTEEIISRLKTAKLDEVHIAAVKSILDRSDLVCFASASSDINKMTAELSQIQDLISAIEKSLK